MNEETRTSSSVIFCLENQAQQGLVQPTGRFLSAQCTVRILDHVYFVHPSTGISVKCWSTYQTMLDRYVGRYDSTDILVDGCTKYTWSRIPITCSEGPAQFIFSPSSELGKLLPSFTPNSKKHLHTLLGYAVYF